jgi:hypothetical protein
MPLRDKGALTGVGGTCEPWAVTPDGTIVMSATSTLV